ERTIERAWESRVEHYEPRHDKANGDNGKQEDPENKKSNDNPGPYRIDAGRICRVRQTKEGPIVEPLCNFVAKVTQEIILDDGAETTRSFDIEGHLETGTPLPLIRIPASRFSSMNWPTESWGLNAVVRAGQGA